MHLDRYCNKTGCEDISYVVNLNIFMRQFLIKSSTFFLQVDQKISLHKSQKNIVYMLTNMNENDRKSCPSQ